MSSLYLVLNFENARLFRKMNKEKVNRSCNDFVFEYTGNQISRDYVPAFIEEITPHQISNMLHVLFNERPVPSLRSCTYPRMEYYFEKAQNSYLKITTPKNDKGEYYYETMHVKKAVGNSWNPSVSVNWEIVKRYIDDDVKFDLFLNKLNEVLEIDAKSIPFLKIREKVINLSVNKRLELYDLIKNLGRIDGLKDYFGKYKNDLTFLKPVDSAITVKKNKTARTVNTGLEKVINHSGQIIVPVNDEDVLKLRTSSKGFAKILDGGLVWIDSIKYSNNISVDGFRLVKDISDEKTKPYYHENKVKIQ